MRRKILALIGPVLAVFIGYNRITDFGNENVGRERRVIVSGASTGIGEQIAYEYCEKGGQVVILSRTKSKLEEVCNKCESLSAIAKCFSIAADFSTDDEKLYSRLISESVSLLGGLDSLVLNHIYSDNSAEVSEYGYYKKFDYNIFRTLFQTNTISFFALANFALPHLEKGGHRGRILVVNSVAGRVGMKHVAPYSATKHALYGYFDSFRMDLDAAYKGQENVTITMCMIGAVNTDNAVKGFKDVLPASSPIWADKKDCARAIMLGGERGLRDVYFPFLMTYPLAVLRPFTTLIDFIVKNSV
eukprot:maker-scaffold_8-snap-gene-13.58-mRNA-1 protein AED:0.35 eAED:0.35 QI:78/1/1/1/0/0.33/3/48/301